MLFGQRVLQAGRAHTDRIQCYNPVIVCGHEMSQFQFNLSHILNKESSNSLKCKIVMYFNIKSQQFKCFLYHAKHHKAFF